MRASSVGAAENLLSWGADFGQFQQLTVVDAETKRLAVYHIDSTGAIELRSVRNISGDLQIDVFNGVEPYPKDIRSLLRDDAR